MFVPNWSELHRVNEDAVLVFVCLYSTHFQFTVLHLEKLSPIKCVCRFQLYNFTLSWRLDRQFQSLSHFDFVHILNFDKKKTMLENGVMAGLPNKMCVPKLRLRLVTSFADRSSANRFNKWMESDHVKWSIETLATASHSFYSYSLHAWFQCMCLCIIDDDECWTECMCVFVRKRTKHQTTLISSVLVHAFWYQIVALDKSAKHISFILAHLISIAMRFFLLRLWALYL